MESFLQQYLGEVIIGAIVLINVVIWTVVIASAIIRRQTQLAAWESFAARTGLTLKPGGLFTNTQVVGEVKGRTFKMTTMSGQRSDYNRDATVMEMTVSNPNFARLNITREGGLTRLMDRAILGKSISTGDAAFDEKFTVHGEPVELVSSVLGDSMLRDSLRGLKSNAYIKLVTHDLTFRTGGVEKDVDYLVRTLDALSALADGIDGWQPPPGYGVEVIDTRR